MDLELIKSRVRLGKYQFSGHAEKERENEDITVADVKTAILNGEILEDYPDDPRGASCLMLGTAFDGRPLHVVLTILPIDVVLFITVYIPTRPKWIDPRTRRPRQGETR